MKWSDLTKEAKSILEWVEHVWTGQQQTLIIKRGSTWVQPLKYIGDVRVEVTDALYEEILAYLPYSKETIYRIEGDTVTISSLRDEVVRHETKVSI